jgi:phosphate transport system substrate-binding protein
VNGEFNQRVLDRADDSALAEVITTDQAGIAIGTMASWYFANKILPVVPLHGDDARFPNQENITTSHYPMPRLYYVYLNRTPGEPLPTTVNEVIHYLLSLEGQNAVADSGLLPGPPEFLQIALKRLNR